MAQKGAFFSGFSLVPHFGTAVAYDRVLLKKQKRKRKEFYV